MVDSLSATHASQRAKLPDLVQMHPAVLDDRDLQHRDVGAGTAMSPTTRSSHPSGSAPEPSINGVNQSESWPTSFAFVTSQAPDLLLDDDGEPVSPPESGAADPLPGDQQRRCRRHRDRQQRWQDHDPTGIARDAQMNAAMIPPSAWWSRLRTPPWSSRSPSPSTSLR